MVVSPVRAWSKSLVARARAAGGREDARGEILGGAESVEEEVVGWGWG